ncbi:MAG: T9SS type A sorting domain-containing protein [Flavobacteriales bacterium]|jgi:hypothetical protein|tara:strand:- start:337 stop:825 length:489 start_codon:yes stop_codon:yes gene_type:complete
MKKFLFTLILGLASLLLGIGTLHAQEAVTTSGGNSTGAGGTVSYSLGQVIYTTNNGANVSIAQGVQQPYEISTPLGIEIKDINLEFLAYPNPTNNSLKLDIGNYSNEKLTYNLYDMRGRLLKSERVTNKITKIGMESFPASTYLLKIQDSNALIKTFRIIKS